jgi:hypothetical protein
MNLGIDPINLDPELGQDFLRFAVGVNKRVQGRFSLRRCAACALS